CARYGKLGYAMDYW
nr:immunoglobulin heavy chain junction region [Mus musculus]